MTPGPRRELPYDDVLRIRAERVEQGLPASIEDPSVLARVAALLDAEPEDASGAA